MGVRIEEAWKEWQGRDRDGRKCKGAEAQRVDSLPSILTKPLRTHHKVSSIIGNQ
jgi:hypothetical protein